MNTLEEIKEKDQMKYIAILEESLKTISEIIEEREWDMGRLSLALDEAKIRIQELENIVELYKQNKIKNFQKINP